jgi:para-nitrobenzyl esterase
VYSILNRRVLLRQGIGLLAVVPVCPWLKNAFAAVPESPIVEIDTGKIRGRRIEEVLAFKGIPYGQNTEGKNRFMPPRVPAKWTGIRECSEFGPTAPQVSTSAPPPGVPPQGEDCLVINVWTAEQHGRRPVMVWLHGGGFQQGSASEPLYDGASLAHEHGVVVVSLNHRLNVLGSTYLGSVLGSEFEASGSVGMQDLVLALQWVRRNIAQFGGDPNVVTIFGHSGGGRKVATLMAMPSAKGLFHRAIVQSGAVLRLPDLDDAKRETELLLQTANIPPQRALDLRDLPFQKLLDFNTATLKALKAKEPGQSQNSPVVDGHIIPLGPWDPGAPSFSRDIPAMIGWARTEESWFDRPTPEKLALSDAGLREMAHKRLGVDPDPVIAAFRETFPNTSPWDLYILIASNHPRAVYTQEMGKRRVLQGGAPVWEYRVDWETPEEGGHLRSPHGVELPFVFGNVRTSGALISKMPTAYALQKIMSSSWAAFARTGDPNNSTLPHWPAYALPSRPTMIFNDQCHVVEDPQHAARLAMEKILHLS